jgi:hypothetical protein
LNEFAWICVGVFAWDVAEWVILFLLSFSSYCVEYNLLRCSFPARHLAANSVTRASASFVCFIFACGG